MIFLLALALALSRRYFSLVWIETDMDFGVVKKVDFFFHEMKVLEQPSIYLFFLLGGTFRSWIGGRMEWHFLS